MLITDSLFEGQELDAVEWIAVAEVHSDHRVNTRPVETAWVDAKVREGFDPSRIGVPTVSKRKDGTYVWLDGQHRGELIRRAGWSDQKIQCRVFYGLTLAREAQLFLGLNDNRQVKPVYKFLARVTSGEFEAVSIQKITEAAGWRVVDTTGVKCIPAVGSLEKVYQATPEAPGKALILTLRVITEAWGFKSEGVKGPILIGLGMVVARFHDQLDVPSLIGKLAQFPGGPAGLLGKARGMAQFNGGPISHCVAETVITAYNQRRRAGSLPDWR
jgi:hypothetical protein